MHPRRVILTFICICALQAAGCSKPLNQTIDAALFEANRSNFDRLANDLHHGLNANSPEFLARAKRMHVWHVEQAPNETWFYTRGYDELGRRGKGRTAIIYCRSSCPDLQTVSLLERGHNTSWHWLSLKDEQEVGF
jgi:hypothetical protein